MDKQYNCIVCSKRTRLKDRRYINPSVKRYLQNKLFITNIVNTDKICNTCMHKYYRADTCHNKPAKLTRPEQKDTDPDNIPPKVSRPSKPLASPAFVSLNIPGASNSHARFVVCKHPGSKLLVISHDARFQAFIDGNILIPAGTRGCPTHLIENGHLIS
jgi:hypothetical protein